MAEKEPQSESSFAVFLYRPEGVTFEDQLTGEKIILLLRAHLITLVSSVLATISFIFVPFLLTWVLTSYNLDFFPFLTPTHVFFIILFWYLFTFGFAFYKFLSWYFNVYILTTERIVDVNFRGVLSRDVSHAKLDRIQDVSPKVIGFFRTFFNFGDVIIQTAGELPEFHFEKVIKPDIVAREILDQAKKEEYKSGGGVY